MSSPTDVEHPDRRTQPVRVERAKLEKHIERTYQRTADLDRAAGFPARSPSTERAPQSGVAVTAAVPLTGLDLVP